MKTRKISRGLSVFLTICTVLFVLQTVVGAEQIFTDVSEDAWYGEAVDFCYNWNLMSGVGDNKFSPGDALTRVQFAIVLMRMFDIEAEPDGTQYFTDIDLIGEYYAATAKAKIAGYIIGYEDGSFRPKASIERQEFFAIIGRAVEMEVNNVAPKFADEDKIADYAKEHIIKLAQCGIIKGYADMTIRPVANITVAEAMAILGRTKEFVETNTAVATPASTLTPISTPTNQPSDGSGNDCNGLTNTDYVPGERFTFPDTQNILSINANSVIELSTKFSNHTDVLNLQTKNTQKINVVVNYLNSLTLTSVATPKDEGGVGAGTYVNLTFSDGSQKTYFHWGNTYLIIDEQYYKMEYEQAHIFEVIVWELVNERKYPSEFENLVAGVNPNSVEIYVNGSGFSWQLEAYAAFENDYFNLRDIAYILNRTNKQFDIRQDEETNTIFLTSGQAYTRIGEELKQTNRSAAFPFPIDSKILLNGTEINLTGFDIHDRKFFRLGDIAKVMDFSLDYIAAYDTVGHYNPTVNTFLIDTSKGYTEKD